MRVWGESRRCVSDASVGGVCCCCVSYGCVIQGGVEVWFAAVDEACDECRYFEVKPGGEAGIKNVRPGGDRGAALETKNHTRVVSAKERRREGRTNQPPEISSPKSYLAGTTSQPIGDSPLHPQQHSNKA